MKNKLQQLITIPFIICLLLLLANDFYFKNAFHNWFTGKLSDFTGLFVFSFFWSVLFPKHKLHIHFLTGIIFTWWKSPLANSFISFFSEYLFPIYRVVDISDLFALVVLPLSYRYQPKQIITNHNLSKIITVIVIFSFLATSYMEPHVYFSPQQFLLFKKEDIQSKMKEDVFYENDSIFIVSIIEISLESYPKINDDFFKTKIIKDLPLYYLRHIDASYPKKELQYYQSQFTPLIIKGEHNYTITTPNLETFNLHFKNSKLHGTYTHTINKHLNITGFYNNGIKDSTWTKYNPVTEKIIEKVFYKNGEKIKKITLNEGLKKQEILLKTRSNFIKEKLFHLTILLSIIVWMSYNFYIAFKTKQNNQQTKTPLLFAFIIVPILAILLANCIAILIPDSYSSRFIGWVFNIFISYFSCTTVCLICIYILKIKQENTILLIGSLLAFLIVFIEELLQLSFLLS